jgi:hypothetical protein
MVEHPLSQGTDANDISRVNEQVRAEPAIDIDFILTDTERGIGKQSQGLVPDHTGPTFGWDDYLHVA